MDEKLGYDIIFNNNFNTITDLFKQENTITFIDENVNQLYPILNNSNNIIVNCIEQNKDYTKVEKIIDILISRKARIDTTLIVIGGGILQDLIGFVASIYNRGIKYILVPTTLLSQTDSCIGSKTSINFNYRKNIIGTFHKPKSIIINTNFINTLKQIDYISGLGEMFKFQILQNIFTDLRRDNIEPLIVNNIEYKTNIVKIDEFDKGLRKTLNFGHTFGHAIEITSNYEIPHGIGVIIGSLIALQISKNLDYKVNNLPYITKISKKLINDSQLQIEYKWLNFDTLIHIIKSDKKYTNVLNMVLINDKPIIKAIDNDELLKKSLNEVIKIIME